MHKNFKVIYITHNSLNNIWIDRLVENIYNTFKHN